MEYWKDKKILLTGGDGFLGRHVVKKMITRGVKEEQIEIPLIENCDLRKKEDVQVVIKDKDIIIHLAAFVGGIGANRKFPGQFFYDNAIMGIHLIHESMRANVEKFVAVGSICAYPKYAPVPFNEKDLWDGFPEETNAPYGLAKKMMLVQCQSYKQQYNFNGIHLLQVNLYGPGDHFDLETSHVIPALIKRCFDAKRNGEKEIVCWGDGSPTREFLYVEDAAEGILLASEKYNKSDPVNLGAGFEISIKELVELIVELTGYGGDIVWDTSKPNGQPRRCLDVTRAKKEFGFEAKTNLKDGLTKTIEWYKSVTSKELDM